MAEADPPAEVVEDMVLPAEAAEVAVAMADKKMSTFLKGSWLFFYKFV